MLVLPPELRNMTFFRVAKNGSWLARTESQTALQPYVQLLNYNAPKSESAFCLGFRFPIKCRGWYGTKNKQTNMTSTNLPGFLCYKTSKLRTSKPESCEFQVKLQFSVLSSTSMMKTITFKLFFLVFWVFLSIQMIVSTQKSTRRNKDWKSTFTQIQRRKSVSFCANRDESFFLFFGQTLKSCTTESELRMGRGGPVVHSSTGSLSSSGNKIFDAKFR